MKKIKDLSLFYRIILLFSIMILLLLFNALLFNSLNSQRKNSLYSLKIISANQVLNQEIRNLSYQYSLGHNSVNRLLRKALNNYNQNFILLHEGGLYGEEGFNFQALNKKYDFILDSLIIHKKSFIKVVNSMIKEPSNQTLLSINHKGRVLFEMNSIFLNSIYDATNNKFLKITIFQIISFLVIIGFILFMFGLFQINIFLPLRDITNSLNKINEGNISDNHLSLQNQHTELGIIGNSINQLLNRLKTAILFLNEIGEEKFDAKIEVLGKQDELGNSLLQIRETFIQKEQEEIKRKEEDSQRQWTNTGLNKFFDIIRHNNNDIKELGYTFIVELVKYLKANQGGFFIYNDTNTDDLHLDLIASIAYDRKKYQKKKILIGEGLLGSCILEKDTIYLSNIPDKYMEIESGLGNSNPGYLLIVPLKIEDSLFGIIEIASFSEFKQYEIEFIETLGENIATAIKSLKINVQTSELLEQAQSQTEELHAQEEEMRQNMEELQATQEDASNKASEMQNLFNAFNSSVGTFEIDTDGYIILYNDLMLKMLDTSSDQLNRRDLRKMIESNFENDEGYDKMWEQLMNDNPYKGEFKINIDAGEVWLDISFTPVKDNKSSIIKVLAIANNITLQKIQQLEMIDNFEMATMKEEQLKHKIKELETEQKSILKTDESQKNEIEKLKKSNKIEFQSEQKDFLSPLKEKLKENKDKPAMQDTKEKEQKGKLIMWNNELSIGIASIDEQHKKLIIFINNFFNSVKEEKTSNELQEIIYDIGEYTRYHFSYEEKYFKEFGFKDTEDHIKEHQSFIESISLFQKDFNAGKEKSPIDVIESLKNQLLNHIENMDKKYVDLFIRKGLK